MVLQLYTSFSDFINFLEKGTSSKREKAWRKKISFPRGDVYWGASNQTLYQTYCYLFLALKLNFISKAIIRCYLNSRSI